MSILPMELILELLIVVIGNEHNEKFVPSKINGLTLFRVGFLNLIFGWGGGQNCPPTLTFV